MAFTKKHSDITKGAAVLMLLFHHLFGTLEAAAPYQFIFLSPDAAAFIGDICKVCVAVFVFVSAYGITRSSATVYMPVDIESRNTGIARDTLRRCLSLLLGFLFVYIIAVTIDLLAFGGQRFSQYGAGYGAILYVLTDLLGLATAFGGTPTLNATWWYMSLALFIILLMPLLIAWSDKMRLGAVALAVVAYLVIQRTLGHELFYILPALWGITFAKNDLFTRLQQIKLFKKSAIFSKLVRILLSLVWTLFFLSTYPYFVHLTYFCYMMAAPGIAYFCFELLACIPGIRNVLGFIGKHSFNIFLTHTFIYYYYFSSLMLSLRYAALAYFALLALSLIVSVLIELLKKVTRYDKLTALILQRVIIEPNISTG